MAFVITADHITDGYSPPGTNLNAHGLTGGTATELRTLDKTGGLRFRLLDDENILDVLDWATANAGATQMLVTSNGVAWNFV